MPVSGQTPTRIHLEDSPSTKWTAGAAYTDPNDSRYLVRDVDARVTGEVDVTASTSVTIDADSNPVIAMDDGSPAGAMSVSLDSSVEDGFIRDVFNESTNTATLTPTSGDINDGSGAASSKTLAAGASCRLSKTSSGSPATAHWRMMKGAGSSGATLAGLSDVNVTSPSDKQVLAYDNASSKWTNQDVNTIALPKWLQYNPDAYPASPSAMDDEFDDASFNTNGLWTALNADGLHTYTQSNGRLVMTQANTGNAQTHPVVQNLPAGNWEFRMKVYLPNTTAATAMVGFILYESGTGKLQSWNFGWSASTSAWRCYREQRTSLTATTSTNGTLHVPFNSGYLSVSYDGTNYYLGSGDGVGYVIFATIAKTTPFTSAADKIGIQFLQGSGLAFTQYIEFFRRVA